MAGVIATIPKFQFSANGVPMVGGTLDTYIAGSTTPATTWQDSELTIANTNPISLDARGECVLWLDPAVVYKFVLKNAQGVIQWTQDNISNPAALANSLRADLAASSGASLVGFQQEGTGAVSTTVQSKLREFVSVKDFGAVGDGVADDTAAIQAACNASKSVYVPSSANGYRTTAPINITSGVKLIGDGTTPYGLTGPYTSRGAGSWFFLDHPGIGFNVANSNGANFVATANFSGIGTYRNHTNAITAGWTPTVFDFDFVCNNADVLMDDVMILNAHKAVNVINGDAGRLTANNVRGQWFYVGINIDKAYDTVRLNNVHMWPFWSNDANVTGYQQNNTTFISLNRCDNAQFSNLFSIYTNIALVIYQNAAGTVSKLRVVNMDNDFTKNGVLVDSAVNSATAQFVNVTNYGPDTADASAYNFRILGSYCRFDVVNLEGSNLSLGLVRIEGTGNTMRLTSARVNTWARSAAAAPVLDVLAGNTLYLTDRLIAEGSPGTVLFNVAGVVKYPQAVQGGTASIGAASTSVVVTHSLPFLPASWNIQIWLVSGTSSAKNVWVSGVNATDFTINCDVAPGASIFIGWRASLE